MSSRFGIGIFLPGLKWEIPGIMRVWNELFFALKQHKCCFSNKNKYKNVEQARRQYMGRGVAKSSGENERVGPEFFRVNPKDFFRQKAFNELRPSP
jgi:hypothetical protein